MGESSLRRRFPARMRVAAASVAALALCIQPLAAADDTKRTVTVKLRERPDYDPAGVRLGGFRVDPWLGVEEVYDDNVYAVGSGKTMDLITRVRPELRVASQWSSHEIAARVSGDLGFYADTPDENYTDGAAELMGRVDVTGDANLGGRVRFARAHERRGSPDDSGGIEPTVYHRMTGRVVGFNQWNRLSVQFDGQMDRYQYFDTDLAGGGEINNDDRDRDELRAGVRAGYQIVEEYEAFLRGEYVTVDYFDPVDDTGLDRGSRGWQVVAGARIDLGGIMFGDVFAGYWRRDFDDAALPSIDGPTYGAALTWNPTTLTTARVGVERLIRETIIPGASGYVATRFDAALDHELLRNLLLGATASYEKQEFEGAGRSDDVYAAGVAATWLMNRNWRLTLGYDHLRRESNASGVAFDDNRVMLRLRLAL